MVDWYTKSAVDNLVSSSNFEPAGLSTTTNTTLDNKYVAKTVVVEQIQDVVAAMLRAGSNITFAYDDTANTFTINAATGSTGGTTDAEVVRDTIAAALVGSTNLQVTVNDTNDTITLAVTGLSTVATTGLYSDLIGRPTLATVATTGAYSDLSGKPTIPAAYTDEQAQDAIAAMFRAGTNVTFAYDDTANTFTINASGGGASTTDPEIVRDTIGGALAGGANIQITTNDAADTITIAVTGLATVATTGAYGDLTGKPALATVATTGAYSDLSGKPTIPAAYTDEQARDAVAAALVAGTNVTITPNDAADTITISATGGTGGAATANDLLLINAAAHNILPGNADNSSALNALINTLTAAGGGTIAFPTGVYAFGSTINLKQGVYLVSAAGNHGYIAASPSAQTVKFNMNSTFTGTYLIDTPQGGWSLGIQGIDLSGNGGAVGGLRFQGVYWGSVKQSMANGFGLSGFTQMAPSGGGSAGFACVFEDLMTTNCAGSATAVLGAGDFDGTDHYFTRNEFAARGAGTGISNANKYQVAFVLRGSNHFVSDSVFETSDRGAVIYATKSRLTACRADTNGGDGWWFIGGANTVTGCDAIGNSQAATNVHDDFIIDNGAWGSYFSNCHSRTAGSINPRYGWNIQTTIQDPVYAGSYIGCSCETAGTARWQFPNGQVAGVLFAPSPVKPAAGTVTPDVHETTGIIDTANYTAATTITNFLNGVDGQSIRILGNTNVTLANNANIITSTGAAKTLTAGVIYTLSRHGGVWRENHAPASGGGGTASAATAAAFYHTGSQTVSAGTVTQITLGATDFNDSTSYFTLANNTVTLVKSGLYIAVWNGDASGGGTAGTRSFFIRINSNTIAEASTYTDGSEVRVSGSKTFRATAGQTLDLAAYFSTSAGLGSAAAKDTGLTVTYLGA